MLRSACSLFLMVATLGCTDLDRFTTAPSESYCGSVTLGSAFRAGFSPRVQMRVQLDAAQLDGDGPLGVVWTYEAAEGDEPERRLLNRAPFRRIPKLENDPLSQLDLGGGRDPSRLFALSPADADEDPLLAVLSFRSDEGIDVRLLRPGVAGTGSKPAPAGRKAVFGVFTLHKQIGTCGF